MSLKLSSRFTSLVLVTVIAMLWQTQALADSSSGYAAGWTASPTSGPTPGVDWFPLPPSANPLGPPNANCVGTSNASTVWAQFSFSGLGIPAGESVVGIEVNVNYGTVVGTTLELYMGGSPLGSKALANTPQASTCNASVIRSAGGATDLWGTSLTTADFNSGSVQVRLSRTTGPDSPISIDIESIELVVYHQGANSPPIAVCQNVTKSANASCQASVSAAEVNNGSSDPDGDPLSFLLSPSGPFGQGVNNVTLTVEDDNAETDSCEATVTVNDNTAPVITVSGNSSQTIECGTTFSDPGATVADNCDAPAPAVSVGGDNVDPDTPGVYVITYDAVDSSGNHATQKTRTVTVEDTTPPEVSLLGGDVVLECAVDTYIEPGSSASDSCDANVSVIIGGDTVDETSPGNYLITYDASDSSGNAAVQKTRTVTVQDTTPPVITLNGDALITIECAVEEYIETGAVAADLCDTDVPVTIGGDIVDVGTPGTYLVTYDAVDDSGNNAVQVTRTVIVEDTIAPEIQCNAPDTIIPPDAPISFTSTASDLCAGDVASTISAFDCYFFNGAGKRVDKTGSCEVAFGGDTLTIWDSGGVKDNIEWTVGADDGNGNSATETCAVLVVNPGKKKGKTKAFDQRLEFAQFTTGDGFSSVLMLQNPSETRFARGQVEFLDVSGRSLESGTDDSDRTFEQFGQADLQSEFTIPPLGRIMVVTPAMSTVFDGSVSVRSDIALAGTVRYSIEGIGSAMYSGSEPGKSLMASVSHGDNTSTSLAVRNTEDRAANVTFSLKTEDGLEAVGGFASLRIDAGARIAVFLPQLFPHAELGNFSGEVVIRSDDGKLSVVAIEIEDKQGRLSALPVNYLEND